MQSSSKFDWVKSVVLLTIFSLLVQVVWWLTYYSSQGTTLNLISGRITAAVAHDSSIWLILVGFLASQLIINLVFLAGICYLTAALTNLFRLKNSTANNLNVALWLLAVSAIVCANYFFFPNSIFAQHLFTLPAGFVKFPLLLVGSFLVFYLFPFSSIWESASTIKKIFYCMLPRYYFLPGRAICMRLTILRKHLCPTPVLLTLNPM